MKKECFLILGLITYASSTFAAGNNTQIYEVDKVLSNGYYIINGITFRPHTSCKMLAKNDKVKFTNGSPTGNCVSATIYDLRTNSSCQLFCEEDSIDE